MPQTLYTTGRKGKTKPIKRATVSTIQVALFIITLTLLVIAGELGYIILMWR